LDVVGDKVKRLMEPEKVNLTVPEKGAVEEKQKTPKLPGRKNVGLLFGVRSCPACPKC
jgi:hypothetical protein